MSISNLSKVSNWRLTQQTGKPSKKYISWLRKVALYQKKREMRIYKGDKIEQAWIKNIFYSNLLNEIKDFAKTSKKTETIRDLDLIGTFKFKPMRETRQILLHKRLRKTVKPKKEKTVKKRRTKREKLITRINSKAWKEAKWF